VDECGVENTLMREYGYGPKGQRVQGECWGKRTERSSIIAGLCQKQLIAPWVFTGYCDTEVVLTWLTEGLIPQLKPGMTVIWDNASFHQRVDLQEAIEAAGCHLLFLPTYSPDLNPIEHQWAELKAFLRTMMCPLIPFNSLLDAFFQQSRKLFT
jgi:putative transposase